MCCAFALWPKRFHTHKSRARPQLWTNNSPKAVPLATTWWRCAAISFPVRASLTLCTSRPSILSLLQAERNTNCIKAQGSMMSAVACASVPKITVVIGGCHGVDSYAMVRDSTPSIGPVWGILKEASRTMCFVWASFKKWWLNKELEPSCSFIFANLS